MLELYLIHGRLDPSEDMSDWGFDGPRLTGVVGVASTYGSMRIVFKDEDAADAAQLITGWDRFEYDQLTVRYLQDMVSIANYSGVGNDGKPFTNREALFGDWGIQKPQGITYDQWLDLVAEYSEKFWLWPRSEALDPASKPEEAFDAKVTPKHYVDVLAEKFGLQSYPDFNWGKQPDGFVASKYDIKPE